MREMPELVKLDKESDDVKVVLMSVDEDVDKTQAALTAKGAEGMAAGLANQIALERLRKLAKNESPGIPVTFFISKAGKIHSVLLGAHRIDELRRHAKAAS